jgi:hypothetical protein
MRCQGTSSRKRDMVVVNTILPPVVFRARRNVNDGITLNILMSMILLLLIAPRGDALVFRPTATARHCSLRPLQQDLDSTDIQLYYSRKHQSSEITSFKRSKYEMQKINFVREGLRRGQIVLWMAGQSPLTETDVRKGIDKVVAALRKDTRTNQELGKLQRVTTILGSGMQQMDTILAVRFNASFQKSGPGWSSVPLPFGLGQSNVSEGRGTMVGQVKASINLKTGKVISCSVFRDLGYGRTFDLKV